MVFEGWREWHRGSLAMCFHHFRQSVPQSSKVTDLGVDFLDLRLQPSRGISHRRGTRFAESQECFDFS
jgi:hypothetical protein